MNKIIKKIKRFLQRKHKQSSIYTTNDYEQALGRISRISSERLSLQKEIEANNKNFYNNFNNLI